MSTLIHTFTFAFRCAIFFLKKKEYIKKLLDTKIENFQGSIYIRYKIKSLMTY